MQWASSKTERDTEWNCGWREDAPLGKGFLTFLRFRTTTTVENKQVSGNRRSCYPCLSPSAWVISADIHTWLVLFFISGDAYLPESSKQTSVCPSVCPYLMGFCVAGIFPFAYLNRFVRTGIFVRSTQSYFPHPRSNGTSRRRVCHTTRRGGDKLLCRLRKRSKQQQGATASGLRKERSVASSFPRSGALALCACAARRPAQVPTEVAGCWRQRRAAAKPRLNPEVVAVPGERAETEASRTPGWLSGAGADREHPPRGSCVRSGSGRACLPRLSECPVMAMVMAAVARTAPVKLRPERWEAGRVAVRAEVWRPPFQALLPGNHIRLLEPIELPGAGLETDLVEPYSSCPHFVISVVMKDGVVLVSCSSS